MSFWSDLFNSIYNDLSSLKNVGDVNAKFGLMPITANSVNQSYNPARQALATREAQARQRAGQRMGGNNATVQNTFGAIDSSYAPAWGDLEGKAANAEITMPEQSQEFSANLFNNLLQQKAQAAGKLSDTSPFSSIFSGLTNIAKILL